MDGVLTLRVKMAMDGGPGSGPHPGAGKESGYGRAASNAAQLTRVAGMQSGRVTRGGGKQAHSKAAETHRFAQNAHEKAKNIAQQEGRTKEADYHGNKAMSHLARAENHEKMSRG
jgi:hypothetical protein